MDKKIHQTVKEAAKHYGVTEETIRRWLREGRLVSVKIGRDHKRIQEPVKLLAQSSM